MKQRDLNLFIAIAETCDIESKSEFARIGKLICRELVKLMKLPKGSYTIRYNPGGIAVMGDVTLHTDFVYVNFTAYSMKGTFMYRSCKHQKDYTGGMNRWAHYSTLRDLENFAKLLLILNENEKVSS